MTHLLSSNNQIKITFLNRISQTEQHHSIDNQTVGQLSAKLQIKPLTEI